MAITLRVVGIFYSASVDLGSGGGSVKDVLTTAMNDPSKTTPAQAGATLDVGFSDTTTGSPSSISATFPNAFTTPIEGRNYSAGTYAMSEMLDLTPIYSVWQYYLFDANNTYLNRGKGAVSPSDAHVADGQSVVLRLVSIHADNDTQTSPRLQRSYLTS